MCSTFLSHTHRDMSLCLDFTHADVMYVSNLRSMHSCPKVVHAWLPGRYLFKFDVNLIETSVYHLNGCFINIARVRDEFVLSDF